MIKVRFAPSPTGIPHIGGTRTALFNFLFAKSQNGEFMLRIEDTDQKRLVKGSEKAILEILKWLEIKPLGEVIFQSKRLDIYKKHVNELTEKKIAYEKDGAIWVNIPDEKTFEWVDLVGNKKISFKGKDVEDFVILKSDGFPTYHLANVIDDHLTGITHVLRGEEWTSSTPKHLYLYQSFGWEAPHFAHLPVILGIDHTKLSKRHGAESALDFRDKGFLKEAVLNYMAFLGWNPGGDKEIMSVDEMIKLFKLEKINTANPIFDITKFEWLNGVWIRSLSEKELANRLLEFDPKISSDIPNFEKYIPLARTRMKTLLDFRILVEDDKKVNLTDEQKKLASGLVEKYQSLQPWNSTNISSATIAVRDNLGSSTQDVYTVLTGKPHGLPFDKKIEIKTQAGTISWLDELLKKS